MNLKLFIMKELFSLSLKYTVHSLRTMGTVQMTKEHEASIYTNESNLLMTRSICDCPSFIHPIWRPMNYKYLWYMMSVYLCRLLVPTEAWSGQLSGLLGESNRYLIESGLNNKGRIHRLQSQSGIHVVGLFPNEPHWAIQKNTKKMICTKKTL